MSILMNLAIGAAPVIGSECLNNIMSKVFGYDNIYLCMFIVYGLLTIVRILDMDTDAEK